MKDSKTVLVMGCFDTKGEDYQFLIDAIFNSGLKAVTMNTGTRPTDVDFTIDFDSKQVAEEGDGNLEHLNSQNDRGKAIEIMGKGASLIAERLEKEGKISGAIGMGGSGSSYIILEAFQGLSFGLPKVCLSTVGAKDLSRQIGSKDIVIIPSIVDIAGINSISSIMINKSVAVLKGMVDAGFSVGKKSIKTVGLSIFGNTTKCADECTRLLKAEGLEVLGFHANGAGGRTMESLIDDGMINTVLDLTTTELADELCGGVCSAGPNRLMASARKNIDQVIVPGCLDMVNFYHPDTVPAKFKDRLFYSWAPDVTLMRTNEEENEILAKQIIKRAAKSVGKVTILLPLRGLSELDKEGEIFYKPEINKVLFDTLKNEATQNIRVIELDMHINDKDFAEACVQHILN